MESKEIIENLKRDLYNDTLFNDCETTFDIRMYYRELDKVLKDLEVLEQLKEILSMDYLVRVYGYDMANRLQTYLKSNEIVKNWLEKRDK